MNYEQKKQQTPARLFYVMGASGAGKDSLIDYVRSRLQGSAVKFARRYITRCSQSIGESHVAVSTETFTRLRDQGAFAMDWTGNGLQYAVGVEIDDWLAAGSSVVINGSREYLPIAAQRYPSLCPVLIEVSDVVLSQRLLARGRETLPDIQARLARSRTLRGATHKALVVIHNDGELTIGGQALLGIITQSQLGTLTDQRI